MQEYEVHQRAEVWYATKIMANSAEEAIQVLAKGQEGFNVLKWKMLLDTIIFQDEYWTEETGAV